MPCWVVESELKHFLADTKVNKPPRELLAKKQPKGHVAYVAPFPVEHILLAGLVAELEGGFLTEVQHSCARYQLDLPKTKYCFGSARTRQVGKNCPLCAL